MPCATYSKSLAIVRRVRPDVLITTGAGSVFFAALFARLAGARVIVIESLSRSQRLSKSARAVGLFAHARVLQNEALRHLWPEAPVFDPIKMLERAPPVKSALLLATVGGTLPFDRLIGGVAALKRAGAIPERVIVQTSMRGARPEGVECRDEIPFDGDADAAQRGSDRGVPRRQRFADPGSPGRLANRRDAARSGTRRTL